MIVGSGCITVFVMLLTVSMATTSSWMGVTAPNVPTATNLSSSLSPKMSAWRGSTSGSHQNHQVDKKHKNGNLTIGLILPYTNFGVREYIRATKGTVEKFTKSRGTKFNFLKTYEFSLYQVHLVMMSLTPSPTGEYTIVSL
jgi:hypothetical protein